MDVQQPRPPPMQMLVEILCRLPVKSLLRFRCVSKTWCAVIDAPIFINKHLIHSKANNSGIIVKSRLEGWGCVYAQNPSMHRVGTISEVQCGYDGISTINHKSSCQVGDSCVCAKGMFKIFLLSSCDGLLYFAASDAWWLYNPSTRKCKKVRIPVIRAPSGFVSTDSIYGFGHNGDTFKDYRAIRILQLRYESDASYHSKVNVYSVRNDSWREIQVPRSILQGWVPNSVGVFVNSAVHWVVLLREPGRYTITAFNFGKEEFLDLPLPDCERKADSPDSIVVVELKGCLSLINNHGNHGESDYGLEGWIMKDYGIKDSWIKLFHVDLVGSIQGYFKFEAGNMFVNCKRLLSYKSEDKSVEELPLFPGCIYWAASYVESLVPLS